MEQGLGTMTHTNTRNIDNLRGKTVVIPKGTRIRTMHPSRKEYVLKRNQRVKVNHTLSGWSMPAHMMGEREFHIVEFSSDMKDQWEAYKKVKFDYDFAWELRKERQLDDDAWKTACDAYYDFRFVFSKPSVRWPGTGGYWCEADTWIVEE